MKKNKNKMGKKKNLFEEEKRIKLNLKDVCVDVFVNVSMERLKIE